MSRKNFKVDTATNGQTATQDKKHIFVVEKTNVPIGKIKTKEDREKRRKAREEQYKTFRVNALKRHAKRIGLSEEEIEQKIKELLIQIDTPNSYSVFLMFNPNNAKMLYAALDKEGIVCKMKCPVNAKEKHDSFCWIDADQETLATLREIAPPGTKIHPYVKKKPPILEAKKPDKVKKPSNNSGLPNKKKDHRKRYNIARMKKEDRKKLKATIKALKASWKPKNKASGTIVPLKSKKRSTGLKKASTELKQAA